MKLNTLIPRAGVFLLSLPLAALSSRAAFVHPGCLTDANDITRIQNQVNAGVHPWIDAWHNLQASTFASSSRTAHPVADVVRGCSPTCTENYTSCMQDAATAYQNALEYVISGNTANANCAVNIMNSWAQTLTTIDPCCSDHYLLAGIQGYQFACAGELLRNYSGWAASDFAAYQNWMMTVWYPVNHDFLVNHNGACISHYWCNWDACSMASMISIGVLCDNQSVFNEAVSYFQTGAGNGALTQAIYHDFGAGLGQWQESGRDQGHSQLGVGLLGYVCEVAWKQGIDLYGYFTNGKTLYDGMEYVARYNVDSNTSVPYVTLTTCDSTETQTVVSPSQRGVNTSRAYWDMLNAAFIRKNITPPYTAQMAAGLRPDHGGGFGSTGASWAFDHVGFSTLTHYLSASTSTLPSAPTGLTARAGDTQAFLSWSAASGATSYIVERSTTNGSGYAPVASVYGTSYTDNALTNGTAYYYVVAAANSAGASGASSQASATPVAASLAPAAPSGLTASMASTSQINLSWSSVSGAASYNVLRATTSGGPYTSIAAKIAQPSFSDYGLSAGTTYYYVVQAGNTAGTSGNSAQASATTKTAAVWTEGDIGAVGTAGSGSVSNGVATVQGAGSDIGGTADSLNFLSESMTGDGTITVRMVSETIGGNTNDKVGLMMRESTAAGAKQVCVILDSGLAESRFAYRSATSGSTTWSGAVSGTSLFRWYRLQRSGNTFTGSVSTDGTNWTTVGSASVTLNSSLVVGFAVCSRDTTALNTSVFDNIAAP